MDALEFILSPVIWLMGFIFKFYTSIVSSKGIAILMTSFSFSLVWLPIQNIGRKYETRVAKKIALVTQEAQSINKSLKGEKHFIELEKIYNRHNYHPIHQVALGTSVFLVLPILISAIFLFTDNSLLSRSEFLLITDLSKPDHLAGDINILPVVMFLITMVDSFYRFKTDKPSLYRFFFISTVLFFLVYNLPASLILFWIGNNLSSLIISRLNSPQKSG